MSAGYEVRFRPAAVRDFDGLPPAVQRRVGQELDRLADDPFHAGTTALEGGLRPYRRARVGDCRVVYTVEAEEHVVRVAVIAPRKDVYKHLSRTT